MVRSFQKVSKYDEFYMPKRSTLNAAGYDFQSSIDIEFEPNEIKWIPTGVKAQMNKDEYLLLASRSSNAIKKGLMMPNGVGVVDSDYFNNDENEGEIFFQMMNIKKEKIKVNQGDRIGQGIFMKYLLADDDIPGIERKGGFGSTGR